MQFVFEIGFDFSAAIILYRAGLDQISGSEYNTQDDKDGREGNTQNPPDYFLHLFADLIIFWVSCLKQRTGPFHVLRYMIGLPMTRGKYSTNKLFFRPI